MTYYVCLSCGAVDDEESCYVETTKPIYGDNDHAIQGEGEIRCPECGGEMIEAASCRDCGADLNPKDVYRFKGNDYCIDCLPTVLVSEHEDEFRNTIAKEITDLAGDIDEKTMSELLNDAFDNIFRSVR